MKLQFGVEGDGGSQLDGGADKMDETTIDREAMGQLANALAFICGADHPTVAAMKKAVASGTERDIKNARTQFLRQAIVGQRSRCLRISCWWQTAERP